MTVKIVHEYTNHDKEKVKEQLEFSLTRTELAENLHLKDEFEKLDAMAKEDPRQMKTEEVRRLFLLVKELMHLTYGVRGEKGGRIVHIKNEEIWESFVEAGVYDSFIWWLFEEKERANSFMADLMPDSLRAEAATLDVPQREPGAPIAPAETEVSDSGQKPKRAVPSQEELMEAYREKMQRNAAEAGES